MSEIIYIQWSNNFGGLEKITKDYLKLFSKYNPTVLLFELNKNGFDYDKQVVFSKNSKLKFFITYIKFIKTNSNKILHFQIANTILLFLAYLIGARNIICQFHGTYSKKNFAERLIWKFLHKKIKIIANSRYTQNQILKNYGFSSNILLIPNLINQEQFKFSQRDYNKEENFIVTYTGRLAEGKNIFLLLEVINEIKKNAENIKFRIFGDGPDREKLLKKRKELSLENILSVQPFSNDIVKIYNDSHLLIFLSLFETFGNVVAESILTGLPILCYKIPSLAELIKDDIFFVEKLDPKLIASRILNIRDQYELFKNKLSPVSKSLTNYLDNKKIMNQLLNIYGLDKVI